MSDDKEIDVKVKATTNEVAPNMDAAAAAVGRSVAVIREHLGGLGELVERIKVPFVELAAVMAGGAAFKEFVEGTEKLGVELLKASEKTGITVEQLSALKYAAEQNDVSFESLTRGMQRLSLGLQQSAEGGASPAAKALAALGIQATDANGHIRPLDQITNEIADKFHNMEDGAGKTALAMNLYGRAGAELIPVLNQGSAGIQRMKNDAQEMGAIMTKAGAEDAEQFHQALGRVGLVGQALSISIGTALMPALTTLANAFADSAKDGGVLNAALAVLQRSMQVVATMVVGLTTAVELIFEKIRFEFQAVAQIAIGAGLAIYDALHLNFTKARADIQVTTQAIKQDFDDMVQNMAKTVTDNGSTISRLWGFGESDSKDDHKKKAPPIPNIDTTSLLAKLKEEWDSIRLQNTQFFGDLKQQELSFWESKLQTADLKGKERIAIEHRIAELTQQINKDAFTATIANLREEESAQREHGDRVVELKRKELEETLKHYAATSAEVANARRALAQAEQQEVNDARKRTERLIAIQRDGVLADIDLETAKIERLRQLGLISDADAGRRLRAEIDASYQAKDQALRNEEQLYQAGSEQFLQLEDQRTQLAREHNKALEQNTTQTALAVKSQWEDVFSTITNAVQTAINGIIQGTQTLRTALANIFASITEEFAAMELKRLGAHIAAEHAMTGATWAGTIQRVALEGWAAIQSVALGAWAAIKNIANYAAQAVAASYAAIAAIPYVGPFLAPAAAAGIGAAVLAQIGHIASAAGGYDIPAGVNPVTQLHAREMVLPASIADVIRGMASGGQGVGPASGGHVHLHVHAIDSKSVEQLFRDNPRAVALGVKQAVRDGHLTKV